jgi:hypothetical protein
VAVDPAFIDASAGSPAYSAGEARLTVIAGTFAGGGASLGVRSGVRPSGSGTDLLVQAQASPNMTVKVNTGVAVIQGAISTTQGPYLYALDATTNLTISAAHASLTRIDRIVIRVRDSTVDTSGQRDAAAVVVQGTPGSGVPSLPTDATYYEIAQVTIVANDTAINSGDITDKRTFTAASGGAVYATSAGLMPATPPAGQLVYRSDVAAVTGRWQYWDGSVYQYLNLYNVFASAAARTTAIPSPVAGMFSYRTDDGVFEVYNGTSWVIANAPLNVSKPSDTSRALTTTLADDPDLVVTVAANAKYWVQAFLIYTAGDVGDIKIGWSGPTSATFDWNVGGAETTTQTSTYWGRQIISGTDNVGGANATVMTAKPNGILTTSGTSGSFKFRWAQGTSEGTAGVIKAGSTLMLTRLS